ncbi:PEPxxWA-CTERM sorting domain-containing protein [Sphingomonas nostoxanthinifaciens]|uniref:PEPxxWA-CTERM sorting domain-containing protein n=1 Tax=Sphingomonas nostoxanthinifaciens TaxID=2872652 RepID=UPI001CC1FCF5|nr:PEPxxWA-CTERM sorting domain-containing protein [Sphingomonas nostoxanthinifaciens]UAK23692.1 PEPxxWA-CTERM sorting domain-containing protein [Sphingomonas nostoxanthinifaciens]
MFRLHKVQSSYVLAVTSVVLAAATPAGATTTTIMITPETYGYYDPSETGNFGLSPFHGGAAIANYSQVGRAAGSSFAGDYAATIEFLIPSVPINAVITGLSLTVTSQFGTHINDVQLRSYFAATTVADPSRIYAGSNLTNFFDLNPAVTSTDLLGTPTVNYLEDNPGLYLGFSFRETNPISPRFCVTTCSPKTIGSTGDPSFYTLPVLTVSYEIPAPPPPPPPSAVPEPSTWLMMLGGFALAGSAARRRQRVAATFA